MSQNIEPQRAPVLGVGSSQKDKSLRINQGPSSPLKAIAEPCKQSEAQHYVYIYIYIYMYDRSAHARRSVEDSTLPTEWPDPPPPATLSRFSV